MDACVSEANDHFIDVDGEICAGKHLMLDVYGACRLDDLDYLEQTVRDMVGAAGATLLHIEMNPEGKAKSILAILAESHIAIHAFPEEGMAIVDVFMCGNARPEDCIPILERKLSPERIEKTMHLRGKVSESVPKF